MSNAKKAIPEFEVDFRGKKTKLVYNNRAFCLLEEKTGLNSLDGSLWRNINASLLSALLWAGLQKYNSEVTLDSIRDEFSNEELLEYAQAIIEGVGMALSSDSKKNDEAVA